MHQLDRTCVAVPQCLVAPANGRRYADLHGHEKNEIRDRLIEMQLERCAYCERRTGRDRDDGHIEHFRNQADHQHLDLDWTNMFWSCQDEKTCGKHKDKCDIVGGTGRQRAFDIADLLNPCDDNPDEFLDFVFDGTLQPRSGLSPADQRRTEESLRVFQLAESPFLRRSREDAVRPYKLAVDSLLSAGPQSVRQYLDAVLPQIEAAPFTTAIRHYLGGLLS